MGRGFGALAKPTGKCKCDNPKWTGGVNGVDFVDHNTKLRYTLRCVNCGCWWYTKSRSARQYFNPDAKVSHGGKTYGEIFLEGDELEKRYLERCIQSAEERIAELNKELESAQKAYDKFMRELESDA